MLQQRVLVVDDEAAVRGIVAALLERSGYQTHTAESAADALDCLGRNGCDLVLSDVMMPDVDGLSLLDSIGTEYPVIPVVMFTGGSRYPRGDQRLPARCD